MDQSSGRIERRHVKTGRTEETGFEEGNRRTEYVYKE